MNLKAIADRIKKINDMNGWTITAETLKDPKEMGLKAALIASEAVEIIDEMEKAFVSQVSMGDAIHHAVTEFSDVIIRVLHIMMEMGIDIAGVPAYPDRTFQRNEEMLQLLYLKANVMEFLVRPSFKLFELMRKSGVNDTNRGEIHTILFDILDAAWTGAAALEPGLSMVDVINAKLDVNENRGLRHGGKAF